MVERRQISGRGTFIGAAVAAVFGVAWSLWAASGLSGPSRFVVAAAGSVIGLVLVLAAVRTRRSATAGPSMFSSRSYRLIVLGEVLAIGAGAGVLAGSGLTKYIPVWVAAVVGVHFLGFGWRFWAGFYVVGLAVLVAAAAGELVGVSGHGQGSVAAVTGIIAAISLFAAAGRGVRRTPPLMN